MKTALAISALIAWLVICFCAHGLFECFSYGQEVDITPPDVTVDPLDRSSLVSFDPASASAVALPQDQQPVTITVGWGNPQVFSNEYTVLAVSVDLQTWYRAAEFQTQSTQQVTLISSNQWLFIRAGNQFGQ